MPQSSPRPSKRHSAESIMALVYDQNANRTYEECWDQGHAPQDTGYVLVTVGRKVQYRHRLVCSLWYGPANGRAVDHKCFNRACANPLHLEWVTWAENNRRKLARRKEAQDAK